MLIWTQTTRARVTQHPVANLIGVRACLLTSYWNVLMHYVIGETASLMPIGQSGVTRCIAGCL